MFFFGLVILVSGGGFLYWYSKKHEGIHNPFLSLSIQVIQISFKRKGLCDFDLGLPTVTENVLLSQFLFAIVPTGIAPLIVGHWASITRYLCIYRPFQDLAKRDAVFSRTLSSRVTGLPPQWVFLRALSSRTYLIFLASGMVVIGQILIIALGGIFQRDIKKVFREESFETPYSVYIENIPFVLNNYNLSNRMGVAFQDMQRLATESKDFLAAEKDISYLLYANLTFGFPLPRWMDHEHFFLPFGPAADSNNDVGEGTTYGASTQAFYASLNCQPLTDGVVDGSLVPVEFSFQVEQNGTSHNCHSRRLFHPKYVNQDPEISLQAFNPIYRTPEAGSVFAAEEYSYFIPESISFPPLGINGMDLDIRGPCGSRFAFTSYRVTSVDPGETLSGEVEFSFTANSVICSPQFSSSRSQVRVDGHGQVLDAVISEDKNTAFDSYTNFAPGITREDLGHVTRQFFAPIYAKDALPYTPHKTAVAGFEDWTTHLMTLYLNNTDIINPALPPMDTEIMIEGLNRVYRSIFAGMLSRFYPKMLHSLSPEDLARASKVTGTKTIVMDRVIMSDTMTPIAAGILGIYLIVVVALFHFHSPKKIPREPSSLGNVITYFYRSEGLLRHVRSTEAMTSKQRGSWVKAWGARYFYGAMGTRRTSTVTGVTGTAVDVEPDAMGSQWRNSRP